MVVEMGEEVILLGFLICCKVLASIETLSLIMIGFFFLIFRIPRIDWTDNIRQ